jgi:hypothetical protein
MEYVDLKGHYERKEMDEYREDKNELFQRILKPLNLKNCNINLFFNDE